MLSFQANASRHYWVKPETANIACFSAAPFW